MAPAASPSGPQVTSRRNTASLVSSARAPRRFLRPWVALAAAFAAEGDRRILWLPVFFGTGIAFYFTLTSEPPPWIGGAATIAAAAVAGALRRWPALRNAGIALAFVAAG